MDKTELSYQIQQSRSELTKFDVRSLAIFGSAARNQATADSDVDILVTFNGAHTFDNYMGLKLFLKDLFNRPVDLVTDKAIRKELHPDIERDLHYIQLR